MPNPYETDGAATLHASTHRADGPDPTTSVYETRSYGVRADGVTDDTAAWARAFAAAAIGGGMVIAPTGVSIHTGLTVPAGVWLQGRGWGSVLKLKAGANADSVTLAGAFAGVSDLRILGNSAAQSGTLGAGVFYAADDCYADRVLVSDTFKFGFYAADAQRPAIRDCTVLNSLYIGIYVEAKTGTVDVEDPVIQNCRVDRSALGAGVSEGGLKVHGGGGKKVLRPRITSNLVRMPASPASATAICIETFGGVDQAVVNGNSTTSGSIGISCDTSDRCSVTGNTVLGPKLYGIEIVACAMPAVSGNTVDGSGIATRGIAVHGSADTSTLVGITGNTVGGCLSNGIYSQGATQITATGNTVRGSARMIQVAGATYSTVTGNMIADPALASNVGIQFDNCVWLTATGNTIAGTAQNGILVFASTAITIRAMLFSNITDINAGSAVSTNLSGGAVLSSESQVLGNTDGAQMQLNWASQVRFIIRAGTPEGVVTAGIGAVCVRTDGGAATTFYVKESGAGNTGWVAK